MVEQITPLIMCGGAGTRLWPASREDRPKQFLRLLGPRSTFQDTVLRVSDPALFGKPVVITNRQYRFLVAEQLAEIGIEADILLEPQRRDSGPAIVAGTVFAQRRGGDPVIVVLAADHVIADRPAFAAACQAAKRAAEDGWIVTFGIRPDRPATDYGYIRPGDALAGEVSAIKSFVEKPNAERAAAYIADGYLWNSGNFLFRASVFLDEYRAVEAQSVDAITAAVETATTDLGFVILDADAFARAKATSDRLRRHGEDQARCGAAGVVRLVRRRLVGDDLAARFEGRRRATRLPARRQRSTAAALTCSPRSCRSRCLASRISWWWRPKTLSWSRGATASTA